MRIARPILMVTTPVGVAWGLYEAWKFGPHLAVLMGLMLAVVGALTAMTVRRARAEQAAESLALVDQPESGQAEDQPHQVGR